MTGPRLAALLVALLLLGACAAGTEGEPGWAGVRGTGAAGTSDGKPQDDAAQPPDSPGTDTSASGSDPRGDEVAASGGGADAADAFALQLSLSADCAVPGQAMTATVRTEPNVMIGLTAYYSDHSYVPDIQFVPSHANATGDYVWAWTLRPTTPLGEAAVEVVAGGGGRGGTERAPFRVARSC